MTFRPLRLLALLTFPVWGFLAMLALFAIVALDDLRMLVAELLRRNRL